MSGDVTLTADIGFLTKTGNEHKKAVLMLRQSLDADSVYADVALHASGLTSLQFRDEKGAVTREIQSNLSAPKRLRIARRGDYVYMSLGGGGRTAASPADGSAFRCRAPSTSDSASARTTKMSSRRRSSRMSRLTQPTPATGQPMLLQHARNRHHRLRRPPCGLSRARALRGSQLDA